MKPKTPITIASGAPLTVAVILLAAILPHYALAYPRYNDAGEGGGCSDCHGAFSSTNSPKGTVFPMDSKHEMHRDKSYMNTDCKLCHYTGDNHNPYTYISDGTANNAGLGCTGCHAAAGLRAHHTVNGVASCYGGGCHDSNETPSPENVKPPYYGTADTRADNPCNSVAATNLNENWSVGDFLGLDNDGNNLYDVADFACGPYRMVNVNKEGNNARIIWQTAGGRTDIVQAATNVAGPYSNISSAIKISGVGVVSTNYLEVGGAVNSRRFYRVKFTP